MLGPSGDGVAEVFSDNTLEARDFAGLVEPT
jgi:hypothetical protein